ncbi:rod shape-determining protein MreD [Psittacicella melopsittaci]|nr:rod shape-determining protein MreD [Psittacicella melopsittaci]
MNNLIRIIFIYLTFFLGFVVTTIPWASEYVSLRPYWILVLLLIWSIKDPSKVGYITALVLGIFADSISGSHLGEHSIAFIIVTFLNKRLVKLYQNIGFVFQTLSTVFLIFLYSIIIFILELFSYNFIQFDKNFFLPILTSTIIWAWLYVLIDMGQAWLGRRLGRSFGK